MSERKQMRLSIVYHHDDPDGHIAGAILSGHIRRYDFIKTIHIPKNYNQEFNEWYDIDAILKLMSKDYDTTIDELVDTDIVVDINMVDLSFTENTLSTIESFGKTGIVEIPEYSITISLGSIVWIDHHASSGCIFDKAKSIIMSSVATEYVDDSFAYFDNNLCGAALTWVYTELRTQGLYPGKITREDQSSRDFIVDAVDSFANGCSISMTLPFGLFHLDAYDRWTKMDADADAWISGLRYYGYTFETGNPIYAYTDDDTKDSKKILMVLTNQFSNSCIHSGNTILRSTRMEYERQRNRIKIIAIGDYRVAIKNAIGNSWNFCDLLQLPILDGGCHYGILGAYDPTVNKYRYSIYRNETIGNDESIANCRKMAESLGGGGHLGASGFALDDSLFNLCPGELILYFYKHCSDNGVAFGVAADHIVDYTIDDELKDIVYVGGSFATSVYGDGAAKVAENLTKFFPQDMIYYSDSIHPSVETKRRECKYHIYAFYPGKYDIPGIFDIVSDINNPKYDTRIFFIEYTEDRDGTKAVWGSRDLALIKSLAVSNPETVMLCDEVTMFFTLGGHMMKLYNKIEGNK